LTETSRAGAAPTFVLSKAIDMEALIISFWMFMAGISPDGSNVVTNSGEEDVETFVAQPLSAGGGNVKTADLDGL
jgi:hypothetical protein